MLIKLTTSPRLLLSFLRSIIIIIAQLETLVVYDHDKSIPDSTSSHKTYLEILVQDGGLTEGCQKEWAHQPNPGRIDV